MTKLLRYIKNHIFSFLLVVILLFSQAQAELALPGFMSDIISFGIQNNGITSAIPDAISVEEFNKIKLFLTDEEISEVEKSFILTSPQDAANKDIDKYPVLENQDLYLIDTSVEHSKEVERSFLFAESIITSVDNDILPVESIVELPDGVSFYQAFEMMPNEQRLTAITSLKEATEDIGE